MAIVTLLTVAGRHPRAAAATSVQASVDRWSVSLNYGNGFRKSFEGAACVYRASGSLGWHPKEVVCVCRRAAHFIVQGCNNIRAWLSVEAIRSPGLSMIQGRIKELAALRFQGAQCDIAHLGGGRISRQHLGNSRSCPKISHAGLRASLRLSDCAHKTQIARPAFSFQGAQCDCAAQLGHVRASVEKTRHGESAKR